MRIGIDFDNTIVCYDEVFLELAKSEKIIDNNFIGSKTEVKNEILTKNNGDYLWQKLQGQVYGNYILRAKLFDGVKEFFSRAKNKKHEMFIISHKTIYGHYDELKTNLHEKALEFIEKQGLFDFIPQKNIFFCETRELKISKIRDLKLDLFIDDLPEVLEHANFPKIDKQLFNPIKNSWNKITESFFGI